MTYAKIDNNIVVNLIELRTTNASEFPNCVPTNGLPVEIGDTYIDEKFYRNDKEVKSLVAVLEEQLLSISELTATEALAIIHGEVEA